MDNEINPSPKHKSKRSLCFSCCFRRRHRHHHHHLPVHSPSPLPQPSFDDKHPALIWAKPKGPSDNNPLSDMKEKCRSMLGISGPRHKRHHSMEFRYDPLSYSLNFEDGFHCDDEAPLRNFSARLPPSPPLVVGIAGL